MKQYKCTITSGGGTEYDGGLWELKETNKTICFKLVKEPFFSPNYKTIKINKYHKGKLMYKKVNDLWWSYFNNGNVIRDWKDGTYTAYPNKCGTPYYFELSTDTL